MPSQAEDRDLLLRYREGDRNALDELSRRYMPLARRLASRYRHTGEPMDDLVQVANMALVKAIERFDPERKTAFSSFAVPTILGELKRYFRDHSWSVHVPRELQERAAKVNKAIESLSKQTGGSPSVKEIANKLDLDLEQVLEALEAAQAFDATSLEAERAGADGSPMRLGDTVGEEEAGFELVEYGASIDPVLSEMPTPHPQDPSPAVRRGPDSGADRRGGRGLADARLADHPRGPVRAARGGRRDGDRGVRPA